MVKLTRVLVWLTIVLTILTLISVVAVVKPVFAQTPSPAASVSPSPVVIPTPTPVNPEVIELRAQTKQMREDNERLLNTVHWTLGMVGTFLVGVVGVVVFLGWYTNFRIYKRDIDALKYDFDTSVRGEGTKLRAELQEETGKIRETLRGESEKRIEASTKTLRTLYTEMHKLEKELYENSLYRIKVTELHVAELSAEKYEEKGNLESALSQYHSRLSLAHELKYDFNVSTSLEAIERMLNGIVEQKRATPAAGALLALARLPTPPAWANRYDSLAETLNQLPDKYAAIVERINALIREAR